MELSGTALVTMILINGNPYPPKAIMAIASEKAGLGMRTPYNVRGAARGGLHRKFRELGFYVVPKGVTRSSVEESGPDAELDKDIEDLRDDPGLGETMCERLVQARIGQGGFRKDVLASWGGRCAVTGCATTQVLRASHIIPWRNADNDERLDPNNGLPLIANLDCLFDAGLIGFDRTGGMVVSFELASTEHLLDHMKPCLRETPTAKQAAYLEYHLEHVYKRVSTDGLF